ncbi:sensor histidine kinase [Paenibacillus sp. YN15]|uniref:sensor histidine kinase n=1 Tax=Paenibacillus sp. YN15 TaxID=1742774 RepID=UPI0015EBD8D6|nr:histidine kinase [Paenibacillus sp. YN15]
MTGKTGLWSPGIYYKLFLAFAAVVLPIIAISFMLNESGARMVDNQIRATSDSAMDLYMNMLELDLNRVIGLQREFVIDPNLNELSARGEFMSHYEIRGAVNEIMRGLRMLKASGSFNEDVRVHIPGLGRTLSASSDSIEDIPAGEYEALKVMLDPQASPFIRYNGRLYHVIHYPAMYSLPEGTEPLFQLVLELSEERLTETLKQFNTSPGSETFLFGNGWSIGTEEGLSGTGLLEYREAGQRSVTIEGEEYFLTASVSDVWGLTMIKAVPRQEIFGPLRQYRTYLWIFAGMSLALIFFFSYGIRLMIHTPLKKMVNAFKRVEQGDLELAIAHPYRDEFGYLYRQFNSMLAKLKVLIREVYEKSYRLKLSEFRQLQSQINPHFLYNSFYIIYRMAKLEDYERVMRFTKYLGEYFQFITRNDSDTVTLEEEVAHVRNYVEIQTMRFARRIKAVFGELPEEVKGLRVPRLILQPVVENAYKHALEDKEDNGLLHISFRLAEGRVEAAVEDNGLLLPEGKLQELRQRLSRPGDSPETTGLFNVARRLRLIYGIEAELRAERSPLGGLLAVISLPLQGPPALRSNGWEEEKDVQGSGGG